MKNIRKFETTAEMDNAVLEDVRVSYVNENDKVYTTPENNGGQGSVDYTTKYTTFETLEDGTFSFTKNGNGDDIQYSKDNGTTWIPLASGETVSVVTGDKVLWKSTIAPGTSDTYGIGTFSSSNNFNVCGNIMSLLYGDDFNGQTSLEGKAYAFYKLFNGNSGLIDAYNLILPATTLDDVCYAEMFSGCTSLTTAPKLPATTLAKGCYQYMFNCCTSLTTAPELPATILTNYCYYGMFSACKNLTSIPELPATTLTDNCYGNMFGGCSGLTTAPELPATTLAKGCYKYMFSGCKSLNHITMLATDISASKCLNDWVGNVSSNGTFVKHPNMTSLPTGTSGIPTKWTVEDAVL